MRFIKLSFILLSILILFSCPESSNPFSEYEGVNLIQAHPLSGWEETDTSDTYLNFEVLTEAQAGTVTALPAGSEVYRLEYLNLAPNGDFETPPIGNGWTTFDGDPVTPPTFALVTESSSYAISGSTGVFDVDTSDRLEFDLSALDGFAEGVTYNMKFDFRGAKTVIFDLRDATESYLDTSWQTSASDLTTLYSFPIDGSSINGGGTRIFTINSIKDSEKAQQDGSMDNLRIVRTDRSYYIYLEIYQEETGRLDLQSGTYRFSCYVKQEIDDQISPSVANRFRNNGISLTTNYYSDYQGTPGTSTPDKYKTAVFKPTDDGADWSGWTEVYVEDSFQIPPIEEPTVTPAPAAVPIITVMIMPTNYLDKDAGSLLIAAPTFEFLP